MLGVIREGSTVDVFDMCQKLRSKIVPINGNITEIQTGIRREIEGERNQVCL